MDLVNRQGSDNAVKEWNACDMPGIHLELKRFIFEKKLVAPEFLEWLECQLVAP